MTSLNRLVITMLNLNEKLKNHGPVLFYRDQIAWFLMAGVALATPTFIVALILFLLFGVNLDKSETCRWWHLPIGQLGMVLISFAFEKIF